MRAPRGDSPRRECNEPAAQHARRGGSPMTLGKLAAAFASGVLLFSFPGYSQAEDSSIRPFKVQIPQAALVDLRRRIAATRWPDKETVADRSQGAPLGQAAGAGSVLGQRLRLAQGGSEAECPAAVHDEHRRGRHSLHPRPIAASECAAADRHARLAGIDHRAAQDHRSAHGSRRRTEAAPRMLSMSSSRPCRATASPASRPAPAGTRTASRAPGRN